MTNEEKHQRLADLAAAAIIRLKELPQPVVRVSGPLTSGGHGFEENMRRFSHAQEKLKSEGYTVFDYVKDDTDIQKLDLAWGYIIEEYHRPILSTELIKTVFFIPGWESSNGARLERLYSEELGLTIKEIPEAWFE